MKTRKLLALVLAIAVLASFISVPVFAEGEGEILEILGILTGTDEDGVTDEYLATTAQRTQAALINLRLLGLDADALAFEGTETFPDAAEATEYWQPVLEYLKANPSVGWVGDDEGNFNPTDAIKGQAFTKVLLVALGYEYGLDFDWETTMDFAAEVGLTALADKADTDLTVEDIAMALVEALGTKTNSTTDVTLLTQLVLDGVIDEADAVAAGFEVEEEAFVIVDAYASAVNEVTVEMSQDVPDDAVVTLKKGSAAYNVTKEVEDNVITLSALFTLPAGTYTVAVDEETAEFEVVKQYAVDLVIGRDSVFLADGQDLKVSLLDQYGDAMSLTGTNYSVFNRTDGYVYAPEVTTTIKIDVTDDNVERGSVDGAIAGDIIYVFVYDPVSGLTVSGELPLIAAPYLETLEVGGITNYGKIDDKEQTDLYEGAAGIVLDVKASDQYGNAMKLTQGMFTTDVPYDYTAEVQILSSNDTVIDPTSIKVDGDGVMTFETAGDGTAMLTFIIPDQANIYTTENFTVLGTPTLDSIEIAGPSDVVYAKEASKFVIMGYDQYGNAFDIKTADGITFTETKDIFEVTPKWNKTNEGTFTVLDSEKSQSSTVYYFLDGVFQGTFDISANATAYPFQVNAVTIYAGIEEGASDTITKDPSKYGGDVEVIDQYGRSYKTRKVDPFAPGSGWDFEVVSKAALTKFTLEGDSTVGYTIGAIANDYDTGAETFIAKLTKDGTAVDSSALEFKITLVESEDIDGFALKAIDKTMYVGEMTDIFSPVDVEEAYEKTATVSGTYGEMSVKLVTVDGKPELIDVITSTNDVVDVDVARLFVNTRQAVDFKDTTTTVKAWKGGVVVAETVVNLSAAKPQIVSITTADKDKAEAGNYDSMFKFYDQYGVGKDKFTFDEIQDSRGWGYNPTYYFFTEEDPWTSLDGKLSYYTIVKWDGSLDATYEFTTPAPPS